MPLTKGLRDEENERIDNILQRLIALDYLPQNRMEINRELAQLAMDMESFEGFSAEELVKHLQKLNFDWANTEQFADYLIAAAEKMQTGDFREKALGLYQYIQSESKAFSFGIAAKIASIKK